MSSVGRGRKCAFGAKISDFRQIGDGSRSKPANDLEWRDRERSRRLQGRGLARRGGRGGTPGDARAVASEKRGGVLLCCPPLIASVASARHSFESCQNAKMHFVKIWSPAEARRCAEALGAARGGAPGTISRREAQACPQFGCPWRQSHSDLIASDSFGGVFIGAEELSG